MGLPLMCGNCGTANGVLAFECRRCGEEIALPGNPERSPPFKPGEHIRPVPSFAWETDNIPDLWRETKAAQRDCVSIDAHDFLGYCLLLRAMHQHFDLEDAERWFDDAIFFLRGGYEFAAHLNTTSRMTMRGRIFGGLRHAGRPEARFRAWFRRIVELAVSRGQSELDLFAAEEITSGTGVNRVMNAIDSEAETIGPSLAHDLTVRFRFFIASTEKRSFEADGYAAQLTRKGRRSYVHGHLRVKNSFRWFHGPLLGYDTEDINGLLVASRSNEAREAYLSIKYTANVFAMVCPTSGVTVHLSLPLANDIPNYVGVSIGELVGTSLGSPLYGLMGEQIKRVGCDKCKELFQRLRGPDLAWPSREL